MHPSSGHTRLALSMAALSLFPARPRAGLHTVEILGGRFLPSVLTVRGGDTLRVVNHDALPHTFTADDGSYDSGRLMAGEAGRLVLTRAGTHHFRCTLGSHRVLVEARHGEAAPR